MQASAAGYALTYVTTLKLQLVKVNGRMPDRHQV
jgi:hypothetical protein